MKSRTEAVNQNRTKDKGSLEELLCDDKDATRDLEEEDETADHGFVKNRSFNLDVEEELKRIEEVAETEGIGQIEEERKTEVAELIQGATESP